MAGYERQGVKEIYIQAVHTVYSAMARQYQEVTTPLRATNRDVELHTLSIK